MLYFLIITITICCYQNIKINKLKTELDIKKTENKNLKRVLFENDLIPEQYIK